MGLGIAEGSGTRGFHLLGRQLGMGLFLWPAQQGQSTRPVVPPTCHLPTLDGIHTQMAEQTRHLMKGVRFQVLQCGRCELQCQAADKGDKLVLYEAFLFRFVPISAPACHGDGPAPDATDRGY